MISEERKNLLLNLISQNGYMEVDALAKKIYISASTVRRNLTELEKMGLVKRSYGKVSLADEGLDIPLKLRFQNNHDKKQIIARKASEFLHDNAIIFVDGSSTCLHMVPYISQKKNIKVFTNGIELCTMLAEKGVDVYCIGGHLISRSLAFAGEYALNTIRHLYFDALFFSCGGISEGMITDYSEPEFHLRKELLKHAREKYCLYDTSKEGKIFNYIICEERDITKKISELD